MSVDVTVQEELWPEEEWRAVPGFEGFYQVSSLGRVMSLPRPYCRGRILKERLTPKGYVQVALSVNGKVTYHYVHRLVMAAFDKPCPEGLEVLHLDDNPRNNARTNLAYDTHKANVQMVSDHGYHWQGIKTQCDNGHEFTPENTYIRGNGTRECRQCHRDRGNERYAQQSEGRSPVVVNCGECNEPFERPLDRGQNRRKFCSPECELANKRARAREAAAEKTARLKAGIGPECTTPGCDQPQDSKGLCRRCYGREAARRRRARKRDESN